MAALCDVTKMRVLAANGAVIAALVVAGCGATLEQQTITGFEASNALSPTGHSVEALADGRFRITATGSPSTPKARVEKIALARAADYGVEVKKKQFQASAAQFSILCGKRDYIVKGEKKTLPARGYTVAAIDVTYTDKPAGPGFLPAKETADALKSELASEVIADDARVQAAREVSAQCGGQ